VNFVSETGWRQFNRHQSRAFALWWGLGWSSSSL